MNDRIYILRQSIVKLTQLLTGRGIHVTQRGITAYVRSDKSGRPIQVNLPYIPDNADEELINAIQGFLDHEVGHCLETDFSVNQQNKDRFTHSIYNIIEDCRIEDRMARRFRGSAYNLNASRQFYIDKYATPRVQAASLAGDMHEVVAILTVPLIRSMAGQQIFRDFMKDNMAPVEDLHDKIKDLAPRLQGLVTTQDSMDLAKEIIKRLRDGKATGGQGKPQPGEEEQEEEQKGGQPQPAPAGEEGENEEEQQAAAPAPAAEEEQEEEQPPTTPEELEELSAAPSPTPPAEEEQEAPAEEEDEEEQAPAGEEEQDEEQAPTPGNAPAEEAEEELQTVEGEQPGGLDGKTQKEQITEEEIDIGKLPPGVVDAIDKETANDYDDTISQVVTDSTAMAAADAEYLPYTNDKDEIEPLPIGSGYMDSMLTSLEDKVDHMIGPMQKDLERAISARSMATYTSGHRSGRIHPRNLYRLSVSRPDGVDDRVFRRKQESTTKDVAVQLIDDCSGSMRGSKIHTAAQASYALASTLERIGIASEVCGFTTGGLTGDASQIAKEVAKMGRNFDRVEQLYMPILKGFDERMNSEVKKRFAWLPKSNIHNANVDGESIAILSRRLLARRETGKVMIVLSDGMPAGSGGGGVLQAHLRRVIKELTKQSVQVVGIGIESDAVSKFYPRYTVLDRVEELPAVVMKQLRQLILGDHA